MRKKILVVLFLLLSVGLVGCFNQDLKQLTTGQVYQGFTKEQIKFQNKTLSLDPKLIADIKAKYPNAFSDNHRYVIMNGEKMFLPEERLFAMLEGTYPHENKIDTLDINSPFKASDSFGFGNVTIEIRSSVETGIIALAKFGLAYIPDPFPEEFILQLAFDQDLEAALESLKNETMYMFATAGIGKIMNIENITSLGYDFQTTYDKLVTSHGMAQAGTDGITHFVDSFKEKDKKRFVLEVLATPGNYKDGDILPSYDEVGIYKIEYFDGCTIHNGHPLYPSWSEVSTTGVTNVAEYLLEALEDNTKTSAFLYFHFYENPMNLE